MVWTMIDQKPTIGRTVLYTLSEQDAEQINLHRDHARIAAILPPLGRQVHTGNRVEVGEVYPLVITRVWGEQPESAVNGQVLLDGNDTLWVSSVQQGEGPRYFVWPSRV